MDNIEHVLKLFVQWMSEKRTSLSDHSSVALFTDNKSLFALDQYPDVCLVLCQCPLHNACTCVSVSHTWLTYSSCWHGSRGKAVNRRGLDFIHQNCATLALGCCSIYLSIYLSI